MSRTFTVDSVDGIDMKDYPDFVDAYIASAHWDDTGEELTVDELNAIDANLAYELCYDWIINRGIL